MSIALGGNQVNKAYLGLTEVQKMYLGSELVFDNTAPITSLKPIMTSFRVEDATPNLVYFSTPLGSVAGIDFNDFTIEGKTITAVNTTGNYFTLSADIDYWDNILIRKEGDDNSVVYDFTLQEVENNIAEMDSTGDKYVEAGASGGDGSIGSPWGFVEGLTNVVAGETLWIKAGSYGAINTTMSVSGTDINPIKVIGYKTTPGDITSMYYTYGRGVDLDPGEMPYFSGGGAAKCVDIQSDYVIWENLQFYNYYRSFVNEQGGVSDGVTGNIIKNCIGHTNSGGTNGNLLGFKGMTTSKCRVLDSICVNTNMLAFCFRVYNGMMKGNKAYADDLIASSDYYFDIKGGSNIIKDNLAHMTYENTHAGHGFALKGRAADDSETYVWQTERNLVEDNTVINVEMGCQQSHKEVMYNVVRNHHHTMPDQFSTIKAYTFFNSSYNIVENGFADSDTGSCITWGVTGEDSAATEGAHDNIVKNTIFTRTTYAVRFTGDGEGTNKLSNNNQAINCTFDDVRYFTQNDDANVLTGNKFVNCIFEGGVYEVSQGGNPVNLSAEYVDFTNCGTWANAYIGNDGNFNEPPLLDANYEPQATFADIDVPMVYGVWYGKNGNERQDPTTVGSILSAEEVPTDTPFEIISYNISEETDTTARVQVYMTEQCSINYYVNGVKNPASNGDFNAGNPEPGVYRHTRTLTELPPGQTSTLVIELTAQDNGEIIQSENIPLTTTGTPTTYDYYVSADGTGDGLSDATPMSFADSQTAINSMTSGQSIAYKGSDEFFGQLTLTGKSGITITSYDGKAIITGAEPITGWSDQGGNVWTKDVTGKVINNVFKNGLPANNTRMPLPDMYTIGEGSSNTSIVCPEIAGISYPDIVGATVYAEQNQWTVNNRPVTAFDPITGTITVSGTESMTIGTGFTIHNSKNLLSAQDDWAYEQGANTLYVYSVGEPTGITATTIIDKGIYLDGCDNITIDNLDVNGFGTVGIALSNTNTTTISNSKVHDCTNRCISENSIYDAGNYDIIVSDCELYNTNDHAIRIYGKVTMEDNIIHDVSMLENRTWTGTSPMTGISVSGDNSVIQRNTMYNFGYNAISFGGQGLVIQNNFIEDHNIYYPDGGGIYTYSEDWTDTSGDNAQILSNTIINYQPRFREAITCIYLDDRSKLITVDENTTQGARRGIYLHNTRDTVITNNTIHDSSQYGITLSEDSNGGEGNMYGNTITGNTILIEESNFGTAPMSCGSQYSTSDFGTLNSNIYYSMGNYSKANVQNTVDFTNNDQFPQENSLSQWQSKYGDDALTTTNTDYYDTFTPENIGSDLIGNGDFTGGVSGWSADDGSVSDGGGFLIGTPSATGCKVKSDSNFAIVIGETYMVQFDVKSNAEQRFKTFINMITGPYYALNLSSILADTSWKTYKYYFITDQTSTNVRLDFYTQSMNEIHLDNVSINKIDLGTPPQNSFLAYNETSTAKDVDLPTGTWDSIDGTVTNATGTVNVAAYSSLIMIKQ